MDEEIGLIIKKIKTSKMITAIVATWLLLGVIGTWRIYHAILKKWYTITKTSYWDYQKMNPAITTTIKKIAYMAPVIILTGPVVLCMSFIDGCWWFTTKGKVKVDLSNPKDFIKSFVENGMPGLPEIMQQRMQQGGFPGQPQPMSSLPPEIREKMMEIVKKIVTEKEEETSDPNQYVVAYRRKDNEELLGYHADTFCNLTENMYSGKRYSGEDPYPQLAIIYKNLRNLFEDYPHTKMMAKAMNAAREKFGKLELDNIYIDAVYLGEDAPRPNIKFTFIDLSKNDQDEEQ